MRNGIRVGIKPTPKRYGLLICKFWIPGDDGFNYQFGIVLLDEIYRTNEKYIMAPIEKLFKTTIQEKKLSGHPITKHLVEKGE